jgi:hypothetical protein
MENGDRNAYKLRTAGDLRQGKKGMEAKGRQASNPRNLHQGEKKKGRMETEMLTSFEPPATSTETVLSLAPPSAVGGDCPDVDGPISVTCHNGPARSGVKASVSCVTLSLTRTKPRMTHVKSSMTYVNPA